MKLSVQKRSVVIAGRKTSVSLEDEFWIEVKQIAQLRSWTVSDLISTIDAGGTRKNLSSAVRVFVLEYYRDRGPS